MQQRENPSLQPMQGKYETSNEHLLQIRSSFNCLDCGIIARVGDKPKINLSATAVNPGQKSETSKKRNFAL